MNNKESKWTCEDGKYVCDHDCDKAKIACPLVPEKEIEKHYGYETQETHYLPTKSDEGLRDLVAEWLMHDAKSDPYLRNLTNKEHALWIAEELVTLIAGKDELSKVEGWQGTVSDTQSLTLTDIRVFSEEELFILNQVKNGQAELSYKAGYEAGKKAGMKLVHNTLEGNPCVSYAPTKRDNLKGKEN